MLAVAAFMSPVTASIEVPWPGLWGTRMRRLFVADGDGDDADQLGLSTIRLTLAALETRAYLLVPPQPIDPLALLLAKLELHHQHQHQQHQQHQHQQHHQRQHHQHQQHTQ
jgi:hypothetical protein